MQPAELFAHWGSVRRGLRETVGKFGDAELDYTPFPGAWSVGELMLHIANAEDGWFRHVVTRELPGWPVHHTRKRYPTVAAILALMDQVHARTEAYLAGLTLEDLARGIDTPWGATMTLGEIIWHVLEHEIHHRGELSLVLGLLGREGLEV